jgi:hypothetical protein
MIQIMIGSVAICLNGALTPSLRALDRQIVVDIMAHLATLPKEK